jgi:hypothetical protein
MIQAAGLKKGQQVGLKEQINSFNESFLEGNDWTAGP